MNPQLSTKPQDADAYIDSINPFSQVVHDAATKVSRLLRQVAMGRVLGASMAATMATGAYAEKLPTVQLAAYVPPEISQTHMQQAFPHNQPTEAEELFTKTVDSFIAEVLGLQESGNNIVPGTDGKTIAEMLNTFTPEQFVRVIAYYGSISNHPESAAMEAIIQVAPELGESREEVDTFIDYQEAGTTGYEILLEEEGIAPDEANITPRQFYLVGKILMTMYPDRGDDVADVLYELMMNPIGQFKESTYAFMMAKDENGRAFLPLLEAYGRYLPEHFGELYAKRVETDTMIAQAEAEAQEVLRIRDLGSEAIRALGLSSDS